MQQLPLKVLDCFQKRKGMVSVPEENTNIDTSLDCKHTTNIFKAALFKVRDNLTGVILLAVHTMPEKHLMDTSIVLLLTQDYSSALAALTGCFMSCFCKSVPYFKAKQCLDIVKYQAYSHSCAVNRKVT